MLVCVYVFVYTNASATLSFPAFNIGMELLCSVFVALPLEEVLPELAVFAIFLEAEV